MNDERGSDGTVLELRTTRLEAFSDGVFAIAITLLVLELDVPDAEGQSLWRGLADQWPAYLAYLISFATVGAGWLAHNVVTEHLAKVDAVFVRLNLLLLLVVSFLPFPTRLAAEHITDEAAEQAAVTLYGAALLLSSLLTSVQWRYAVRAGLLRSDVPPTVVTRLSKRLEPGLVGYLVLIVVGLVAPTVVLAGYLLIALFLLMPFHRGGAGHKPHIHQDRAS